jgi:hypothetical protein
MFVYPATEDKLNQVVSKYKGKSSTGFDQIREFLVQECIHYIKKPFFFIFLLVINQGIFPDLMKTAQLRPIYKKDDMTVVITAYTHSISVLEKLMCNRLTFWHWSFTFKF